MSIISNFSGTSSHWLDLLPRLYWRPSQTYNRTQQSSNSNRLWHRLVRSSSASGISQQRPIVEDLESRPLLLGYQASLARLPLSARAPVNWLRLSVNGQRSRCLSSDSTDVDVTIIGGGPVGLAIACGLAGASTNAPNYRVLLLEAGRLPALNEPKNNAASAGSGGFSNRAVALSPSSVDQLRRLGVWDDSDSRVAKIRRMRVLESDSTAALNFNATDNAIDGGDNGALASVTELAPVVARLARKAASSGAQLREGCRLERLVDENSYDRRSHLRLQLNDKSILRTRLLIGCDGFGSPVRRLAGIQAVDIPYSRHRAMVATLEIDGPDGLSGEAFQRFLPDGPIALLPLPGRYASLVWCDRSDQISALLAASDADFLASLNRRLATGPGQSAAPLVTAVQPSSRAAFPLGFMHANRYSVERIVLAGDAAHRLSPLAGQGMNLGMEDAACLTKLLIEAASNGADPADPIYLKDYETQRQRQVVPVAVVNEALGWFYSLSPDSWLSAPLRWARTAGFRLTDSFPVAKEFLRKSATTGRIELF